MILSDENCDFGQVLRIQAKREELLGFGSYSRMNPMCYFLETWDNVWKLNGGVLGRLKIVED